jgi:hypothetical protein
MAQWSELNGCDGRHGVGVKKARSEGVNFTRNRQALPGAILLLVGYQGQPTIILL